MNEAQSDLITLVLGIFGILIVASAVGYVLQKKFSPDGANSAIENLNARIKAWWIMHSELQIIDENQNLSLIPEYQ